MTWKQEKTFFFLASIFVLLISLTIFGTILYNGIVTDIQDHAIFIIRVVNGELKPPANFLYYLTVYAVSLFRSDWQTLLISSGVVLSLAVTVKFMLTYYIFRAYFMQITIQLKVPSLWLSMIFSIVLLFVFSLPTFHGVQVDKWYIGQIPPNVWHNSTTIFVMPFALLLFWFSYQSLRQPTQKNNLFILILSIANILIKPSFFLIFTMVYTVLLYFRLWFSKKLLFNLWPMVISVIVLLGEYLLIYLLGAGNMFEQKGGIKIALFAIWSHYSPNIPVSVLVSTLYPLVYLIFNWKELISKLILKYTVLLYLTAIVVMATLTETGPREFHGNFFWQSYICNYILFMVISILFVEKLSQQSRFLVKQNVLILSAFGLHIIAGLLYLGRLLLTGRYF